MTTTDTGRLDAALRYAAAGLAVLPVYGPQHGEGHAKGKRPHQANWQHRVNTPEQLRSWFTRFPSSNVGLVTGARSGWVCVDIDPRNGGDAWYAEHRDRLGGALVERTGGGGIHLWFRHPGGWVTSRTGKLGLAPGVELKADGGHQVVVAPSIHPSGGVYAFENDLDLANADDLAEPLPAWIAAPGVAPAKREQHRAEDFGNRPEDVERCREHLAGLEGAIEGSGGDAATFIACCLGRDYDLDPDTFWPLLLEWNTRCQPPWGEDELRTKLGNAYRYARNTAPGEASPARQFAEPPASGQLGAAAAEAQAEALVNWLADILRSKQGWKSHTRNVELVLTHDERVANAFRYNALACQVEVVQPAWRRFAGPPEWTDADPVALANWIARAFDERPAIDPGVVHQAVAVYARQHSYHPIRDYLQGLTWDRTPRIDTWLPAALGIPDTPYHRAVGRCFLIAAIARVMRPGCQVDTMLILEGEQGTLKSSALRTLFGADWFTDAEVDPESKDAAQVIRGRWCVEFAELHGMNKAEVNALKQFLTRRDDRQRDAYARAVDTHPRQCVFTGTTNQRNYLRDESGGRRFWPVGWIERSLDLGRIAAQRDQLWAEAHARFEAGERWWLSPAEEELAQEQQADRFEVDEWEVLISDWLEAGGDFNATITTVTAGELWTGLFGSPLVALGRMERHRIASAMRRLGWSQADVKREGKAVKGYRRPESASPKGDKGDQGRPIQENKS
jgi:predicted P-loop ATPase